MTLPEYFTVLGDFRSVVADLATDLDHDPQIGPVTATVTFKPMLRDGDAILATDATPRPTGYIAAPIVAKINSSGRLVLRDVPDGTRQIVDDITDLPGTGDAAKYYVADDTGVHYRWNGVDYDEILPYAPVRLLADTPLLELATPLYYTVTFSSVLFNGRAGKLNSFTFAAPNTGDAEVNLIEVMRQPGQPAAGGTKVAPNAIRTDGEGNLIFSFDGVDIPDPVPFPAMTNSYSETIGNGATTSLTVDHELGTLDVLVSVHNVATGEEVDCDVVKSTGDRVILTFATAPALNSLRCTVLGTAFGLGAPRPTDSTGITDATVTGRALITADDAAEVRSIISAERASVFNVKDYGATGNGTTDDTAAIHAARDAAGVNGTVVFPAGTYKIVGNNNGTGALQANVAGQVWDIMPGATLIQYNHARALITVSAAGVTLTGGGTLNGGRSTLGTDGPGVALGDNPYNVLAIVMGTKDSTDLTIENLTFTEGPHWGVWGQASRTRVLRCTLTRCWGKSILLASGYLAVQIGSTMQDTYDMEASYNFIDRSDETAAEAVFLGIQMRGNPGSATPGDDPHVTYRPKALYNTILLTRNPDEPTGSVMGIEIAFSSHGLAQGNRVVGGAMGISFARHAYGQSIGNTFIAPSLFGQELADSVGAIVQGNTIDGDGIGGIKSSGAGITGQGALGSSTDALISGNRIFNMHSSCRPISGAHSRWVVTGNSIEARYGINFTGQTDSVVSGNSFKGDSTVPAVTLSNCTSITVTGNTIRDYSAGIAISATSGASDYINITGNHFRGCTTPVDGTASGGTIGTNIVNANNTVRA